MSNMAQQIRERMAADGIDTSTTVDNAMSGSPAQGTDGGQAPITEPASPAGVSNTDTPAQGGPPDSIPYSRFQEVNAQLQQLRPYAELARLGIAPEDAVRLVSFEANYQQDPQGTIIALLDQQDLPETQKTALKALLQQTESASDGALPNPSPSEPAPIPPEVTEAVDFIRELKTERQEQDTQRRLDFVSDHWKQLDEQDKITTPERQRLLYIQHAAGSGQQFQTLEQMAEYGRALYLEDRDGVLGSAVVQRGGQGQPLAVPSGGLPPTEPLPDPKSMKDARARIMADIAAGRLPDLQVGG